MTICIKIKAFRNEAGWNSVYVTGKIIKIGPILAIRVKILIIHMLLRNQLIIFLKIKETLKLKVLR